MTNFQKQSEQFLTDSEDLLELALVEYQNDPNDNPSTDEALCLWLTKYDGEEHDLIYWSGRLSLAKELDEETKEEITIRVPITESDCQDLQSGETFSWTFNGVNLFLFNSDINPEYDPDSEEYDPSISI